ncbi:MAG TPA: FHA domain-containing protein [Polyangiales bacterium]
MSTQDQNKKTLRHFQCRDYLWEIFEQMSTELECSTDYLINEAMRQYARSRNYGTSRSGQREPTVGGTNPDAEMPVAPAAPAAPAIAHGGIPSLRESAARPSIPSPPPPRPRTSANVTQPRQAAAPAAAMPMAQNTPTPGPRPQAPPPAPPPPKRASSMPPPPPGPRTTGTMPRPSAVTNPPPLPGGGARASMAPPAQPNARPRQLFVIFNGQKIPVSKEEFVIGRGSKSADLAIKDGNISRRHAAVVLHNGAYYMKDLGSTNGVEYQGRRFDSKRIEEGDIFRICDYELRFSYQ